MLKRVYLEITNDCNLNCSFCTNEKGHNYLSLKQIDDYTSQIKHYCDYIYLHILGEPLLHPDFEAILDILDKKAINLQLVTNGTLLFKYPDIFKHKCLRKLSISIHSISNTNVKANYFEYINKIIELDIDTNIELRFYDTDNLSNDVKDYLTHLENTYGFSLTSKNKSYKLKDNKYVYFQDLFNWPNINDPFISDIGTCHGGIDMIGINANSDVTICCLDPKAHNKIGNLKENTLDEILKSDKYQNIIKDLKNHKINLDLCQKCSYRSRFE